MKSNSHSSPVDHHIQADAVRRLFVSNEPISFSVLKPGDIENSLFTYHMHKLERRGVVQKSSAGYSLTPVGVRWVNFTSPSTLRSKKVPRVLLNLVIFSPDKQRVVLARRTSRAAEYFGGYLFPSGFQPQGMPITEGIVVVAQKTVGVMPDELEYVGIYETIYADENGDKNHWVLPTFTGVMSQTEFPDQDNYSQQWVDVRELLDERATYTYPLADIVRRCLAGERFEYDTYTAR